jgi:hypothetical protein
MNRGSLDRRSLLAGMGLSTLLTPGARAEKQPEGRIYENRLIRLDKPKPLLADHPAFVEPVRESVRYEAPVLVDDKDADLHVRAWRFSYNARGIIEMPNRLRAAHTAVIMVHPWGIDDGQGWKTPEPAGVCDFCTPEKNALSARHTRQVINPFLKSLRGKAAFVMYSLPGDEDPIRRKLYRSFTRKPTEAERAQGARELKDKLTSFNYKGQARHRLPPPVPRPRRRREVQRRRLLGSAHPGVQVHRRASRRRGHLRHAGVRAAAGVPPEEPDPPRPADRLLHGHVLLQDHGGVSEPG